MSILVLELVLLFSSVLFRLSITLNVLNVLKCKIVRWLGRPEQPFRMGLCFTRDVIFIFFISPLVLRRPSTDRPETLPHGRNLV